MTKTVYPEFVGLRADDGKDLLRTDGLRAKHVDVPIDEDASVWQEVEEITEENIGGV